MVITTLLAYLVARRSWGVRRPGRRLARVVLPGHRAGVLLRQHHQDPARRLVPAGHRGADLPAALDLEEGARRCSPRGSASGSIRSIGSCRTSPRDPPHRVPGHRGVHDQQPDRHAADAAPQPRAQPGAARAGRAADGGHQRRAARRRGRPPQRRAARAGLLPGDAALRVHGGAGRAGGAGARRRAGTAARPRRRRRSSSASRRCSSTHREGMARWRERLFAVMSRNAVRATSFFRIPPERVVELGMQIEL